MWGNRVFNLRYWIWALGKILPEWMRWDKVYIRFKFFNFNFCSNLESRMLWLNLCTILVILIQSLQGMEISRINSICYLFYATSRNLFITTLISALNDFYSNWLKLSHDENRSSQFVKFVLTYEVEIPITLSVENKYEFAIILWIWMWQSQSDRSHRYFTFTFTDCLLDKKILLLKITLFCYVEDYLSLVSAISTHKWDIYNKNLNCSTC